MTKARHYISRHHTPASKAYYAALLVAGVIFYIFNVLTTLKGDDLLYSYIIGSDYQPIDSLADLLRSVPGLYVEENGRMANVLTQLMCGIVGKPVFNVLNALMLMLLLHLVSLAVTAGGRSTAVIALTSLMLLCVAPFPGETLLWTCGSLNYLWAAAFSLGWLLWLREHDGRKLSAWQGVLLFLASWVAGQMNEAVTVPVAFGVVLWLVLNRKRPGGLLMVALAGYCVGVLIILCSPGAWLRVSSGGITFAGSVAWALGRRLLIVGYKAVVYVFPATAVILMIYEWVKRGFKQFSFSLLPWMLLGCVILLFILGDSKKPRLYFFYTLVGFIYTMQWLYRRYGHQVRPVRLVTAASGVACVALAAVTIVVLKQYKTYNDGVVRQIVAAPANCVLPAAKWHDNAWSRRWIAPNHYDSESYSGYNDIYEQYYGKQHVAFVRPGLMARYKSARFLAGTQLAPMRSSRPDLIDKVYLVPRATYSIIPIDSVNLDKHNCGLDFNLDPVHNRMTQPKPGSGFYYDWTIRVQNHLSFFNIFHRGQCYLIVPAVERDVVHLSIPVVVGGKEMWVDLDRK